MAKLADIHNVYHPAGRQNWRGSDWGRSEARPPWDNAWARTMEETIEHERNALPLAYPRRRRNHQNHYIVPPREKKATPKSTYMELCFDLSPRLKPQMRAELVPPERPPTRPNSARPDLQYGPIDNKMDSTHRQAYAYAAHQQPTPRPASARGEKPAQAAGMVIPRDPAHLTDPMCQDESVQWQRKIKIVRAQLAIERQARREADHALKDMLRVKAARKMRPFRSRMTTPR